MVAAGVCCCCFPEISRGVVLQASSGNYSSLTGAVLQEKCSKSGSSCCGSFGRNGAGRLAGVARSRLRGSILNTTAVTGTSSAGIQGTDS
ncbi:hypothetical protein ACFLW6_03415 [Chloroflexota bacterium]